MRLLHELDPASVPASRLSPSGLESAAEGMRVLSAIARAAGEGAGRHAFRVAMLAALRPAIPFDFAFVASPPRPRTVVASLGAPPPLARLLSRHARAAWAELMDLRRRAPGGPVQLSAAVTETPLLRLLGLHRPVSTLGIGWTADEAAAVVLAREGEPGFRRPELELLRLALPVFALADAHAADLADSVGTALSPREQEIFEYLQRGYSNRQIALVLGTSPLTVRNQLCRLFRKAGVASRAELVGLAASPWVNRERPA